MRFRFSPAAFRRKSIRIHGAVLATVMAASVSLLPTAPAQAQAIALAVNGDPITNIDLEQRMKLLRALRRPASRDAAIESMISDRLKIREAGHFGITIKDNEIGEEVTTYAAKLKTNPQQLLSDIERSGVQQAHFIGFFKAELGFEVLIKAMNKGVEASETQVRSELAKGGGKASATEYTIRQIVLTLGPTDSPATIANRAKQAEALRGRFTSCASGIPYAKTLDGVAVRDALTRSSTSMSGPLKDILDKTPIGHLTPPARSSSGLEMVAICERGAVKDDSELRKVIADRILQAHIDQEATSRLKEMRSRAIIEKR